MGGPEKESKKSGEGGITGRKGAEAQTWVEGGAGWGESLGARFLEGLTMAPETCSQTSPRKHRFES